MYWPHWHGGHGHHVCPSSLKSWVEEVRTVPAFRRRQSAYTVLQLCDAISLIFCDRVDKFEELQTKWEGARTIFDCVRHLGS